MRAVLYTRVSTRDKGQEVANQLKQLQELCMTLSWEIVHRYEDHDSGSRPDRVTNEIIHCFAGNWETKIWPGAGARQAFVW